MNYTLVLRSFYQEWEAIIKLEAEDKPTVPTLSKNQTPLKWIDSFQDCLSRTYGIRGCPLSYVIREDENVAPEADDPLVPMRSY